MEFRRCLMVKKKKTRINIVKYFNNLINRETHLDA